jgi:5-methylcytosine-specific restriction endonuclease McrA
MAASSESADGQQRLTSINSFIQGRYPDGEPARLSRLKIRPDLAGKTFDQLSEDDQEAIQNYALRIILIQREADPNLKYEIFERLNSGSQVLSDMELRNCLFRGPYNDLLRDLATNKHLLLIRGAKSADEKMRDRQLILRFFAMSRQAHHRFKSPMGRFLNTEMELHRNATEGELAQLRSKFENAIEAAYTIFGSHAFRRYNFGKAGGVDGDWPTSGAINVALWDTILYSFSYYEKRQLISAADAIREEFLDLLTHDDLFLDYIGRTTDKTDRIVYRADTWLERLKRAIQVPAGETRAFSHALKVRLYNADPTCALCGQHVQDINDAEVDHIKHYWRGGATIPENARLAHRFCNRQRGGR